MINLVVALATESRPLIEHFRLSEDRSVVGFRAFRGDGVRLVVTGLGRVACAAGVAALGEGSAGDGVAAWLNVGIAGHARHPVGQGTHAVRIAEAATGRRWYPARVFPMPGRGEPFVTVDSPEVDYKDDCIYDMEASAFYATALRYATSELVQAYKIVSDNCDSGVEGVDKHKVRDLIAGHLVDIEAAAAGLSALADDVNRTEPKLTDLDHIIERWHFTVSQRYQLRDLLRRWETLSGGEPLVDSDLNRCPSAKSVLAEIRGRLEAVYRRSGSVDA